MPHSYGASLADGRALRREHLGRDEREARERDAEDEHEEDREIAVEASHRSHRFYHARSGASTSGDRAGTAPAIMLRDGPARTASRPSSSLRARTGTSATCSSSAAARPVRRPPTGSRPRRRRARRREEALPAGEDLRRRPHASLGPPALRHGPRRRPGAVPPLRGPAREGLRRELDRHDLARASRPARRTATSSPAPTSTSSSPRRAEKAGAVVWQGAEAVSPLSAASSPDSPREPSPVPRGQPLRRAGGAIVADGPHGTTTEVRARYVIVADGVDCRGSGARSARGATGTGHRAWRSAATTARRATTSRTSSRISTSATPTATSCPATAGSSRSATVG